MKNKNERGFFDEQFRLEKLTAQNDPLVNLLEQINWVQFRKILTNAFDKEEKGVGGRPPFDYVMMFKIMVLQRYEDGCQKLVRGDANQSCDWIKPIIR